MERAATEDETKKIEALLGEAMDAGAFGFSSTLLNQHMGYGGRPLACRNASRAELKAYCNALRSRGKGAIEIAMTRQIGVLEDPELELLDFMLAESGRPVTFIALFDRDDLPEAVRESLRKAAPMIARGARPQTSPLPLTREFSMRSPFSFGAFPSFKRVFEDKSKAAQAAVYRDPAFRAQFRKDLERPMTFEQLGAHHAARGEEPGAEAPRGAHGGRARGAAGQGPGGRVPGRHAGRRSRQRIHHAVVQHACRPHGRASERPLDPARPGRRRRAPRHAVRRRLPDLRARHLGTGKKSPFARGGGAAHDLRPGRLLRHPRSRPHRAGACRRPGRVRPADHWLGRAPRAALRPAGRREAHGDALGRRRADAGQRRADLGGGRADGGRRGSVLRS